MIDSLFVNILLLIVIAALGLWHFVQSKLRKASDVLFDLQTTLAEQGQTQHQAGSPRQENISISTGAEKIILNDELGKIGLFTLTERSKFKLQARIKPLISSSLLLLINLLFIRTNAAGVFIFSAFGYLLGYLYQRGEAKRRAHQYRRELEFYLPIVMERLVMAVQAGLDIIAAINAIVELENNNKKTDPVTRLLQIVLKLTESGLTFEVALRHVAELVECSALRHAFIHLAVAHQEGGELVMPLKELSDSTQLYFQESVDEEIAKLPVKATMPLVLTFTGLIICFITSPIIQILGVMQKQMETMHL